MSDEQSGPDKNLRTVNRCLIIFITNRWWDADIKLSGRGTRKTWKQLELVSVACTIRNADVPGDPVVNTPPILITNK